MTYSYRSPLTNALVFGLCGALSVALHLSSPWEALSTVISVFLIYSLCFLLIMMIVLAREPRQTTPERTPILFRHSITLAWALCTLLWLLFHSVFVVYPALQSGVYLASTEREIWESSFPAMPSYVRAEYTWLILPYAFMSAIIFYYPLTFYFLAHIVRQWKWFGVQRRWWYFLLPVIGAIWPFLTHRLTNTFLTWFID